MLDELLGRLTALDPKSKAQLVEEVNRATKGMSFVPNTGPQTEAYLSAADVTLYGGQAGGGKGLELDTLLPTPTGWTTIGEVKAGDLLFDDRGQICRVTAVSEPTLRQCFRLTFDDGSSLIADDVHRWVTFDAKELAGLTTKTDEYRARRRAARPPRGVGKRNDLAARNSIQAKSGPAPVGTMRDTAEISRTLVTPRGRRNHAIVVASAIQLPAAILPVDPYVLGVWLGDGSAASGNVTGIDDELWQHVEACGETVTHSQTDSQCHLIRGLKPRLRALGVLNNKHVPAIYLRGSAEQRLALLAGLMDTDGHAALDGGCEFDNTRRCLIDAVYELAVSLGLKATITEGRATLYGKDCGPKWRVKFTTNVPVFRLSRKLARLKSCRRVGKFRYIIECSSVPSVVTKCISVDSPSNLFLAGRSMVPTHNTMLELGWGVNEADSGIIFRRQRTQTDGLEKEGKKLIGDKASFNGQHLEWTWPDGKTLKLAGMNQVDDWMTHAGRERDYMAFDEAGEFLEMQVAQIIAWLRAAPGKRCRVILGSNPPRSSDGSWLLKWFAPWLDDRFINPAVPGELRWACGVTKGEEYEIIWVDGPGEYEIDGERYTAKSYTFIPASLTDNPYRNTPEYRAQLQSLPEPLRSQLLYGDFKAGVKDAANQVIPTAWVRAAQERWVSRPPQGIPMCNIGVDCSGGGDDPFVMAPRYDGYFASLVIVPGAEIPQDRIGTHCAGLVVSQRRDECPVTVDLGGGYGGSTYEHLKANGVKVEGHKGAADSVLRTKDKQMGFKNKRSEVIWRFREALDPEQQGGSPISLPPSQRLLADLTAPTWEPVSHKGGMAVKIESKEDVCKRLGRSTDEGDAVVMSWSNGAKALYTQKDIDRYEQGRGRTSRPAVLRKTLGSRR